MKKLIGILIISCLLSGALAAASFADETVTSPAAGVEELTSGMDPETESNAPVSAETETVTLRLVEKAETPEEKERREIVEFAKQFVGNPYVYGGTSLTNGADCSGFVFSVFAEFGYSLPRSSGAQYGASVHRELSALEPGDLVFYGYGGSDHVAIYIGDDQVVHAANSSTGIVISDITYCGQPSCAGTFITGQAGS